MVLGFLSLTTPVIVCEKTMNDSITTVQPTVGCKDKTVGWYDKTFPGIEPEARKLLEEYSHIAPEEVDQYVIEMV